jgi:hypothetical protein
VSESFDPRGNALCMRLLKSAHRAAFPIDLYQLSRACLLMCLSWVNSIVCV